MATGLQPIFWDERAQSIVSLEKGDKCLLKDLTYMSEMNGNLCKIIGSYRLDDDRFPVFVYKTKQRALIKSANLKKVRVNSKSRSRAIVSESSKDAEHRSAPLQLQLRQKINSNQQNILETLLSHTMRRRKHNQAKLFADNLMKSHPEKQFDSRLSDDFKYMLHGNSIYIPSFFNQYNNKKDMTLFNFLMQDLEKTDCSDWPELHKRLIVGWRHDHDEDDNYMTFRMIVQFHRTDFSLNPIS